MTNYWLVVYSRLDAVDSQIWILCPRSWGRFEVVREAARVLCSGAPGVGIDGVYDFGVGVDIGSEAESLWDSLDALGVVGRWRIRETTSNY